MNFSRGNLLALAFHLTLTGQVIAQFQPEAVEAYWATLENERDEVHNVLVSSAQLSGIITGDLEVMELPSGSRISRVTAWGEQRIHGLQLEYQRADGRKVTGPLLGRDWNKKTTVDIPSKDALFGFIPVWDKEQLRTLALMVVRDAASFDGVSDFDDNIAYEILGAPEKSYQREDDKRLFLLPGQEIASIGACVEPFGGDLAAIAIVQRGQLDTEPPEWRCGNAGSDDGLWSGPGYDSLEAMPYYLRLAGPWVEKDAGFELMRTNDPRLDGKNGSRLGTYKVPKYVRIEFSDEGKFLRLHGTDYDDMVLPRISQSDSKIAYALGLFYVTFSLDGFEPVLAITTEGMPHLPHGGRFVRAKLQRPTTRPVIDKVHFPERQQPSETWRGLFEQSAVLFGFSWNLSGYDGPTMNVEEPDRGLKDDFKIFAEPDDYSHYLDTFISKSVPDGLIVKNRGAKSLFEYSETAITSAAEMQRTVSTNFGLSGGAKGGSLGVSYSNSQTKGMSESSSTMMAMGNARIMQYSVVLDRASIKLTPEFSSDMTDVIYGRRTARSLIDKYGTHYANAITYGGGAVATKSFSQKDYATWRSNNQSVSVSGGAKGVSGSAEASEQTSSRQNSLVSFTQSDFRAIGGKGSTTIEAFSPGENPVPVLYDLRPLSELAYSFYLPELPRDQWQLMENARDLIDYAIEQRFAEVPLRDVEVTPPAIFKVTFDSVSCSSPGDEPDNEIELSGDIRVSISQPGGSAGEFSVWSSSASKKINCDGLAFAYPGRTLGVYAPVNQIDELKLWYQYDLKEHDTPPFDPNETAASGNTFFVQPLVSAAQAKSRADFSDSTSFGGREGMPKINVNFAVERIE